MGKFYLLIIFLFPFLLFGKEISLWHSFSETPEKEFVKIIDGFNASQKNWKIIPKHLSDYPDCVKRGMEAFLESNGPHILQVSEVAARSIVLNENIYYPVYQLMKDYKQRFSDDDYLDVVKDLYSSSTHPSLPSFPWNVSTGIMYYNKDAFKKAGLDAETPPKTWPELEEKCSKLQKSGYQGFATAWPTAYHIEHFSFWHNLPYATKNNGFGGKNSRLVFNQPEQVYHLTKLVEWHEKGLYTYNPDFIETEKLFIDGKCGIYLSGGNKFAEFQKKASFSIGVGKLPFWPHLASEPSNINIGGASFWVLKGKEKSDYEGVAHFFTYLSQTDIHIRWHLSTGYLPITKKAYDQCIKEKTNYKSNPAAKIAIDEVFHCPFTPHAKGIKLVNHTKIRNLTLDHLEKALNKQETPQQALDAAVEEGNAILQKYENKSSAKKID